MDTEFKPRAMAFDLDGTLAESKQLLTSEMGYLIMGLLKKMPVAVLSGAGFPQFERQFLSALPPQTQLEHLYLFPTNASQCYIYKNDEWKSFYDHSFTIDEKTQIIDALNEALLEIGFTDKPESFFGEQIEDRGAQITFSALGQKAPLQAKQRWDPTKEKRLALRNAVAKRLPGFSVATGGMTSIDITRKGITKTYGVIHFSDMTKIPIQQMLYVGDALEEGGNDAVVISSGIHTYPVLNPEETAVLIKNLYPDYKTYRLA